MKTMVRVGAILRQGDGNGNFSAILYASQSVSKHEKNYSAFLVELTGCTWGIENLSSSREKIHTFCGLSPSGRTKHSAQTDAK
jgi:hypothetical protein